MSASEGDTVLKPALLAAAAMNLAGCQSAQQPPIALVDRVDLPRFMGDWYVISSIPTFLEKRAHNAIASYRLAPDGSIETTFTFRAGGFDGEEQRDYVWIMARTPSIPEADYRRILVFLAEQGYDVSRIQRVPQRWEAEG